MSTLAVSSTPRAFSLSPALSRRSSTLSRGSLSQVRGLDPAHKGAISLGSLNSKTSDFEIVTVSPAKPRYLCPVCSKVLRYPLQFEECGHRCCSACLPEILRVAPRCPVDQMKIDRNRIHAEDCRVRPMSCPRQCGLKVGMSSMDKHLVNACPNKEITCVCCQATMRARDEVEHMRACGQFPVQCPNGCGVSQMARQQMMEHTKGGCPKESISCPYAEAGCSHQCLRRDLDVHLSNGYESHLRQVAEAVSRAAAEEGSARLTELTTRVALVEARLDNLRKIHAPVTLWKIEEFDEKARKARKIGGQAVLASPHMSTKRHGYRLQLHAHLDGDEIVQGHYMSIYASLCHSEYDRLIPWPFARTVTITLLDQSDRVSTRCHKSHVLDPATVGVKGAFDRPKGSQNPPFGVVKFIRLEDLTMPGRYVKDNAIFLHVKIDD